MERATFYLHMHIPGPRHPEEILCTQRLNERARAFRDACFVLLQKQNISLAERTLPSWPPTYIGDERTDMLALFVVQPEEQQLSHLYPLALKQRFAKAAVLSLRQLPPPDERQWNALKAPLFVQSLPNGLVLPKDYEVQGGKLADAVYFYDGPPYEEVVAPLLEEMLHDPWKS